MSSSLMMEAVRTSETSVDNHFTRQYNPEDSSEHHYLVLFTTTLQSPNSVRVRETKYLHDIKKKGTGWRNKQRKR
jgi:hypothetical protein